MLDGMLNCVVEHVCACIRVGFLSMYPSILMQ